MKGNENMTDKYAVFDELLKQVDGGKIVDKAGPKVDALIKRAKDANYTKEEFVEELPRLLVSSRIVDGNNLDEDVARITAYVNFRWDYVNN